MHCWIDYIEGDLRIEFWSENPVRQIGTRLVVYRKFDNRIKTTYSVFIEGAEAQTIGRSVIVGDCPPAVLADWIEEHPDCWRSVPGYEEPIPMAMQTVLDRLRQTPLKHSLIN